MHRRRSYSSGSSLFAFQDVMASLIGIIFFVVILIAMDMVDQGVAAAVNVPAEPSEDTTALAAKLDELHKCRQEIQTRIEELTDRLRLALTRSSVDLEAEIRKLNRRLLQLYQQIEQANDDLKDSAERRDSLQRTIDETLEAYAAVQSELLRLEQAAAEMAAEKEARSLATVAYIVGDSGGKEPWLVEITSQSIRVANVDGRSSRLDFNASRPDERIRQFLSWANSQNSNETYFVLLIKPSGLADSMEIGQSLVVKDFSIGIDLLPEDWNPFHDR